MTEKECKMKVLQCRRSMKGFKLRRKPPCHTQHPIIYNRWNNEKKFNWKDYKLRLPIRHNKDG
ncbi:hypothetical protein LCGC14_2681120 [marine sediment metagenome]|uniref:Uncharacterized protein n=1 Tax=marine sediment metagenome TaxID=412755 RepID=A0A0F8ZLD0_9ZZZZ